MRSAIAGFARELVVGAVLTIVAVAAIASYSRGNAPAAGAVTALDQPILTQAVVLAASPAPPHAAKPIVANAKPTAPRSRVAIAPLPRPRPSDNATADPAKVALIEPTSSATPAGPPPEKAKSRFFAPVGFVRDNVARLMSWL